MISMKHIVSNVVLMLLLVGIGTACAAAPMLTALPTAESTTQPAHPATQPVIAPAVVSTVAAEAPFTAIYPAVYYAADGDDRGPGTEGAPRKNPRLTSNTTVLLRRGDTFAPLDASGLFNGQVSSYGNPALPYARILVSKSGGLCLKFWTTTRNYQFDRLILDSTFVIKNNKGPNQPYHGAVGIGARVRGWNITLSNISLDNLAVGLAVDGASGVTRLRNINQLDPAGITGQSVILLGCGTIDWDGGNFLNSINESPVRISAPGPTGGIIQNIVSSQSIDPKIHSSMKACFAIHQAVGVTFNNCTANNEEFSCDTAGAGVNDRVSNCTFNHIVVNNSKLDLRNAVNCVFNQPTVVNPTGEGISISGLAGNKINGAIITTGSGHGIHYYKGCDTAIIGTVVQSTNPQCVVMDGPLPTTMESAGNHLLMLPTTQRAK